MAKIVLGIGTSHGPMLATSPEDWDLRLPFDRSAGHFYRGRQWSFEELVEARARDGLAAQIDRAEQQRRLAACRVAIARLTETFMTAGIDVAVIVGNDQMEIYDELLIPPFSVMWGEEIANSMYSDDRLAQLPPGIAPSVPGYIPPGGATYRAVPDLAQHLIRDVMAQGFDVAAMKAMPKRETPHAYGFVYRQIMQDRPVPSVPVVLNTFYPPNQPTVGRCWEFGRALGRAIASWESDARVAIFASGGLTHFVIDEAQDALFPDALTSGDFTNVLALEESRFQDGTSEVKNWIAAAGALKQSGLAATVIDYVPCYRSLAGTGNAMGFVEWR